MITVNFETEHCDQCGVVFQVTEEYKEGREADGEVFWCPNGHALAYQDYDDRKIEKQELEILSLRVQVRQLKCQLLGEESVLDKIKRWWKSL